MVSIREVFRQDHEEVHKLFNHYEDQALEKEGIDIFNQISNKIKKHIQEEEEMYTLISRKSKELDNSITYVRQQHTTIKGMIDQLVDIRDKSELRNEVDKLRHYLEQHEKYEEDTLYRLADEVLSDHEREMIANQLEF